MPDGVYYNGRWEPLPEDNENLYRKPVSTGSILGKLLAAAAVIAGLAIALKGVKRRKH